MKELSNKTINVPQDTQSPSRDLNHVSFKNGAGVLPARHEPVHSHLSNDEEVKNAGSFFNIHAVKRLCSHLHITTK
jgi:hypothetical protein